MEGSWGKGADTKVTCGKVVRSRLLKAGGRQSDVKGVARLGLCMTAEVIDTGVGEGGWTSIVEEDEEAEEDDDDDDDEDDNGDDEDAVDDDEDELVAGWRT